MTLPTEPIGSIPRPPELIEAVAARGGKVDDKAFAKITARVKGTTLAAEALGLR